MMDPSNRYGELMSEVYAALTKADAVKKFRYALMARAEAASRDLTVTTDARVVDLLRGQISICFELADGAQSAQESAEARARAAAEDGIPEALRQ